MIKVILLVTGDMIVGKVELLDSAIKIIMPLKVFSTPSEDPTAPPTNRVEPFGTHVKSQTITFKNEYVLFVEDPSPLLEEYYEKNILSSVPFIEKPAESQPIDFKLTEEQIESLNSN